MKTRIHVNQAIIKSNRKNNEDKPVLTVKTYKSNTYAKEVVISDLDEPGIEDVMRKVMSDIEKHSAPVTEDQVRAKIGELESVAIDQIKAEI